MKIGMVDDNDDNDLISEKFKNVPCNKSRHMGTEDIANKNWPHLETYQKQGI